MEMKSKKGEFQIMTTGYKKQTVNGFILYGVGIHKASRRRYNVTHIPSGYALCSFRKIVDAKKYITIGILKNGPLVEKRLLDKKTIPLRKILNLLN